MGLAMTMTEEELTDMLKDLEDTAQVIVERGNKNIPTVDLEELARDLRGKILDEFRRLRTPSGAQK